MNLTPDRIKEFQAIAREEYGVELTFDDASVHAKRLLLLYELIYQPLPEEIAPQRQTRDAYPPAVETHRSSEDTQGPVLPKDAVNAERCDELGHQPALF